MDKLLQILIEEAESLERGTWYESGYDVKSEALTTIIELVRNVQRRLEEEN